MVVRKRQIIAAALVLALGSAVFINWYYNRPSVKSANAKPSVEAVDNTGGNLGDAQLVNSSGVSESAVATGKSSDYSPPPSSEETPPMTKRRRPSTKL